MTTTDKVVGYKITMKTAVLLADVATSTRLTHRSGSKNKVLPGYCVLVALVVAEHMS